MNDSISRRKFFGRVAALGAAAGSLALPDSSGAVENPDPDHLNQLGRGWRVLPTGNDDRDNLQWAMRNTQPGGTVRLVPGTYKIGRTVIVPDFDGKLVGAGSNKTTITCTDEYSYELWETSGAAAMGHPKPPPFPRTPIEGTPTKTAPGVLLFYKTPLQSGEDPDDRANRIEIRGIRCRGAMLGEHWMFGDEVLCITILNSTDWLTPESTPVTTRQDISISDLEVDGYSTAAFGPFEVGCACVAVLGGIIVTDNYNLEGSVDGDTWGLPNGGMLGVTPAEGVVTFSDCTFRNCRLGPTVMGLRDSNVLLERIITDRCRGNCLQIFDNSNSNIEVRDSDVFCESFLLPPEFTVGGATDVPSSLGCVVSGQGLAAVPGISSNVQWLSLAIDTKAHKKHPEAGPIGTWRGLGPALAPQQPSTLRIADSSCRSSLTPNTYCLHVVDFANMAFGTPTVQASIKGNSCADSQTCFSLEHVAEGEVRNNHCSSQAVGVELHNSPAAQVYGNSFGFPPGEPGCEILTLALGDKFDLSRVKPGAGMCTAQG